MLSFMFFLKRVILPWLFLALVLNLMRGFFTETASYIYLNWNLFLAFVPLLASSLFIKSYNVFIKAFLFFVWLFFLPNAFYIVTDFIHLRDVGPQWLLWYDGMMIFSYTLLGIFFGVYSLLQIQKILDLKNIQKILFSFLIAFLSSFGIYLGRYIRWNTWDILTRPVDLATNVFHIITTQYSDKIFVSTLVFFSMFIFLSEYSLGTLLVTQEKK